MKIDLLRELGRRDEARALYSPLEQPAADAALDERIYYWGETARRILDLKQDHRYREAIAAFPGCVRGLEELERCAVCSDDEIVHALLGEIRSRLSGVLANWATSYSELADLLDDHTESGEQHPLPPELLAQLPDGTQASPGHLREEGLALLERALEISVTDEVWRFACIQAHRMAGLMAAMGRKAEERTWLGRTCDYATRARDAVRSIAAHELLGWYALEEGKGIEALEHLEEAARAQVRFLAAAPDERGDQLGLWDLSTMALRSTVVGGDPGRAIMVVESLKAVRTALSLRTCLPGRWSAPGDAPPDDLVADRERLRGELDLADPAEEPMLQRQVNAVESLIEERRHARALRDPAYLRWCDATHLDLADLAGTQLRLRALGDRTTLVGFVPAPGGVWAYAVWPEGATLGRVDWPDWMDEAPAIFAHVVNGCDADTLRLLAEKLLSPMEQRIGMLEPADRIVVSATSVFHHVPFAALPVRGQPLCTHVTLSQVQGIGVMQACTDAPPISFSSVLCVAVPNRPGYPVLPGAGDEVLAIGRQFRDAGRKATVVTGLEATVRAFQEEASNHDVVHLACHGVWRAGERQRLVLHPADGDSGDLTDRRILAEVALKPGCLVNLSSCGSAVQRESGAEVEAGLVPAMLVAGARAVIATLWPVRDDSARRFQEGFYGRLLGGQGAASALSETQRMCLRGEMGELLREPRTWAAFTLFGIG